MRSLLALWLITLFSLTSLSAADYSSYDFQDGALISVEEYWQKVADTHQTVRGLEGQPADAIRQGLNALASQWDQVRAVALEDGSILQTDTSYLVAQLRAEPPVLSQLSGLLEALLQAHEEYPAQVFTTEDITPLQEILRRPEFQWAEEEPLVMPGWLARLFDWIDRLVNGGLNTAFSYGRLPLIAAAVVFFVLSLFFISRGLSRSLVREAQLAAEERDSEEMLTSKGALKRAETLSTQGDYRNAIRYLYLSSLLVLDEQGVMRYDRSRTNREYLRSVSSRPELAKPLNDVIDVFDRVWYGYEAVDETTYHSYVEHVEELREKKE